MSQFGEGFCGSGDEAAHINTVLGARGGPIESAWATALASPSAGHTPFVAVLQPGLPVLPYTLFVSKATIEGSRHASLTWGAAQAGLAKGVVDAVRAGIISSQQVHDLLLIAAVWVSPAARDEAKVFENNARAALASLKAGAAHEPDLSRVLAARAHPFNPFFSEFEKRAVAWDSSKPA